MAFEANRLLVATRLLLDTHVVIRWLADPKKLSRDQKRALDLSISRAEPFGVSAITLLELALLARQRSRLAAEPHEILQALEAGPEFLIVPLSFAVADEVASMGTSLRDFGDRTIVATARVHHLRLLTSDQRIIQSKLVPIIE